MTNEITYLLQKWKLAPENNIIIAIWGTDLKSSTNHFVVSTLYNMLKIWNLLTDIRALCF